MLADNSSVIEIRPVRRPVEGAIRPPGSKSITNRALVCAALAEGTSTLIGALDSEDTQVMVEGLEELGIGVEDRDHGSTLEVAGCGGKIPNPQGKIFVGNSGTTIRFLTALVALGKGDYRLDGIERMRQRPIVDLADALRQLGVDVVCESDGRCPPVIVKASGLHGGTTRIKGNISSQYLSGLLMAAPCAGAPVTIEVEGTLVSVPYVEMTLRVMQAFGAKAEVAEDYSRILVQNSGYQAVGEYSIEPDASAASYFWAAAAVTRGKVTVEGLHQQSLQGDVRFVECLAKMGCEVEYGDDSIAVVGSPLRGIDVDMNAISDTVQTLAVVALFAEGTTRITNIGHIRHKETDRLSALATELRKLGADVVEHGDALEITPPMTRASAAIDTYNDHRMAMSFAIAGLAQPGVAIKDPGCTAKTYPGFFNALELLTQCAL